MKIEALRKIRVGKAADNSARGVPRGETADVDKRVADDLISRGLAKASAGRPSSGGQSGGGKKSQGGGQSGNETTRRIGEAKEAHDAAIDEQRFQDAEALEKEIRDLGDAGLADSLKSAREKAEKAAAGGGQ